VTIFGRTYTLRGNEDGTYLADLASTVDRKMREVAEATGTADTLKVAILASLNIADEYVQARRGSTRPVEDGLERRLGRLVVLLDEALGAHAGRSRRTGGKAVNRT
jgi:cell division protein ZapA